MSTRWPVFTLCCVILLHGFSTNVAAQESKKILLKVNMGGGPVADFLGEDQVFDLSDFSKTVVRDEIQNTDQPEIFQTQRFARGLDMTFRIPVPDGIYSLTLLFAETFKPACALGARVFDISLGTPSSGVSKIVDGFDIFQSAGCLSAHGRRFDNVPSKEGIVVHLTPKLQHPSLCGFIVEGFPVPKGDGSEYKAIARESATNFAESASVMESDQSSSLVQASSAIPPANVPPVTPATLGTPDAAPEAFSMDPQQPTGLPPSPYSVFPVSEQQNSPGPHGLPGPVLGPPVFGVLSAPGAMTPHLAANALQVATGGRRLASVQGELLPLTGDLVQTW